MQENFSDYIPVFKNNIAFYSTLKQNDVCPFGSLKMIYLLKKIVYNNTQAGIRYRNNAGNADVLLNRFPQRRTAGTGLKGLNQHLVDCYGVVGKVAASGHFHRARAIYGNFIHPLVGVAQDETCKKGPCSLMLWKVLGLITRSNLI